MILVRILKCCWLFGRVIDGPHVICDENDDEEKKTEGGVSYCMETNILAASLSDRTVRLIDGNTGTYLSIMDFEFISTQSSFSLLGLVFVLDMQKRVHGINTSGP